MAPQGTASMAAKLVADVAELEQRSKLQPERDLWDDRAHELAEYWKVSPDEVRAVYRRYNVEGTSRPPPFEGHNFGQILRSYGHPQRLEKDITRLMLHYTRFAQAAQLVAALGGVDEGEVRLMIDYGCGVADYGLIFGLVGYRVTLVDLAGGALDFAKWRFERRGLPVEHIPVDAAHEDPTLSPADVVVAGDVLEHLPDPRKAVRAVADCLRPGGHFWFPDFPFKEKSVGGAHLESAAALRTETAELVHAQFERAAKIKHLMRKRAPSA